MDTKQENLGEAVVPTSQGDIINEVPNAEQTNLNYDFNFGNQTNQVAPVGVNQEEVPTIQSTAVADPAIGKVNPNPVMPENIVPIDIDTAAGATAIKVPEAPVATPVVQSTIRTSGTATEEEIVIDASKQTAEVLDEFAITMDANAEKIKNKKNNIFIGVVFGVIILFILLLKVIINIVGY